MRFRNQWVVTLADLRRELGFKIVGYVLMPEHFHALIWPTAQANPSQAILNYMHNNPVNRGLVKQPGDWAWSSWRFYFLNDTSLLAMDPAP
jgi:hypothetical protein